MLLFGSGDRNSTGAFPFQRPRCKANSSTGRVCGESTRNIVNNLLTSKQRVPTRAQSYSFCVYVRCLVLYRYNGYYADYSYHSNDGHNANDSHNANNSNNANNANDAAQFLQFFLIERCCR